jgi:hypothetical protein
MYLLVAIVSFAAGILVSDLKDGHR